tara:strand:+ start:326 stop:757 length:432 start_codon:yes stop_codon:yes gene_type:complete
MTKDTPDQSQQISIQLEALEKILEQEFSALKNQDMDAFDKLQPRKTTIMEMLGADGVIESINASKASEESNKTSEDQISSIKILIDRCHELHRRNEILINRKLEAVKGALASLREGAATDEVEVYTKAGGLAKPKYGAPIKKT